MSLYFQEYIIIITYFVILNINFMRISASEFKLIIFMLVLKE